MNRVQIFAIVTFLALALVGCGSPEAPAKVEAPKTPEAQFIDDVLTRTGGDITKVTPEERKQLDEITRGNTQVVFQDYAKKKGN